MDLACDKKPSEFCGLNFACGLIFICEVFSDLINQALPNRNQTERPHTFARMHVILPFFLIFRLSEEEGKREVEMGVSGSGKAAEPCSGGQEPRCPLKGPGPWGRRQSLPPPPAAGRAEKQASVKTPPLWLGNKQHRTWGGRALPGVALGQGLRPGAQGRASDHCVGTGAAAVRDMEPTGRVCVR